jgi:hypothetical protein
MGVAARKLLMIFNYIIAIDTCESEISLTCLFAEDFSVNVLIMFG